MRVIIAGSRDIRYLSIIEIAVEASGWRDEMTRVVSGNARGVDRLGEWWAQVMGIPVTRYPVDWKKHGKAAGPIRNEEMAQNADALIAIWDGKSRGTKDMIQRANKHGLKVFIYEVGDDARR